MKSKSFRLTDEAAKNLAKVAEFTELSESKIVNLLLTQPMTVDGEELDVAVVSWVITEYFKQKIQA